MNVLVAGATGMLGSELCRRALAHGHRVTGLHRSDSDPGRVEQLRALGVTLREAELTDPDSLPAVLRDVDAVISGVTAVHQRVPGQRLEDVDLAGQRNLIDAAGAAGVRHFVYISFSGNLGREDALTRGKRASEAALRDGSMDYTILRPSYFMEVWLTPRLGLDHPNARATIYGDGERPVSWISYPDVAEFAVRSLELPAARNATIELGGPEALSPLEVVHIFQEETGREFTIEHVPEAALEAQYDGAQESLPRSFAALMLGYAGGDPIPMAETAARFGVTLRSVRDHARAAAAAERPG